MSVLAILQPAFVAKNPETPRRIETSVLGFLCDLDIPDDNGAIFSKFELFLDHQIPLIISRSFLAQSNIKKEWDRNTSARTLLKQQHVLWDIYLQKRDNHEGEIVLLIPKRYASTLERKEKLNALGFSAKKLELVSYDRIVTGAKRPVSIHDFFSIFRRATKTKPIPKTFFFLNGHGGPSSIAGLKKNHYIHFLNFLQKRKALALSVASCQVGGPNSLIHLYKTSNPPIQAPLTFPVFLHSIGDFSTTSETVKEAFETGYFEQLTKTITKLGGSQSVQLQLTLRKLWKDNIRDPNNLMIFLPPHKKDSPCGFRPAGEGNNALAITYTTLRCYQLPDFLKKENNVKRTIPFSPTPLVVEKQNLLEIFPLCITVPLAIKSPYLAFLSMIPGTAHHLFTKIIYTSDNHYNSIFLKTMEFYPEDSSTSPKAFFIGESCTLNQTLYNVCLYFSEKRIFRLWKTKEKTRGFHGNQAVEKYFYQEYRPQKITIEISAGLFVLEILRTILKTTPTREAIRSASGGQESEQDFRNLLFNEVFWNDDHPMPPLLQAYLKKTISLDKGPEVISNSFSELIQNASPAEKLSLVVLAILAKRTTLALHIIKLPDLDVNGKPLDGCPLLCLCAKIKNRAVTKGLLARNADVNITDADDMTPLYTAALYNHKKIVKQFLALPQVDIEVQDKFFKWKAILFATSPTLFHLFVKKGALVNIESSKGMTFLGKAALDENFQLMEGLIAAGADVNAGTHSPLNEAIATRQEAVVRYLLKNKADPNQADGFGDFPMIEVINKGTPSMLQLLVEHGGIITKKVLIAAYTRGCKECFRVLIEYNPNVISNNLLTMYETLHLLKNWDVYTAKWVLALNVISFQSKEINYWQFQQVFSAVLNFHDEDLLKIFLKLIRNMPEDKVRASAIEHVHKALSLDHKKKYKPIFLDFFPDAAKNWFPSSLKPGKSYNIYNLLED